MSKGPKTLVVVKLKPEDASRLKRLAAQAVETLGNVEDKDIPTEELAQLAEHRDSMSRIAAEVAKGQRKLANRTL